MNATTKKEKTLMIRTDRYFLIWTLAIPGLLAFPVVSSATQPG